MKKIIILLPLLLCACLEQGWIKDGATQQDAHEAYQACKKMAKAQKVMPAPQYTDTCMTTNGWIKVDEALEDN